MKNKKNRTIRDLGIIIVSIVVAIILAKTNILTSILTSTQEMRILGSFIAGMLFVSTFTVTLGGMMLFKIATANSIWEVALFGSIGALIGNLLIFRFIRNNLSEDIHWLIQKTKQKRLVFIFQLKVFRWIVPFVGALIVASPFPDEIGLAMMGLSKMKMSMFMSISFGLHFFGILTIGLFAKGVL